MEHLKETQVFQEVGVSSGIRPEQCYMHTVLIMALELAYGLKLKLHLKDDKLLFN